MNRTLFDWTRTASDVFVTVMLATLMDGVPVLKINEGSGDIEFGIAF